MRMMPIVLEVFRSAWNRHRGLVIHGRRGLYDLLNIRGSKVKGSTDLISMVPAAP